MIKGNDHAGPVHSSARIETLDVLRGFALFGVLAVNIGVWLGKPAGSLDLTVKHLVEFFFEGKFWPLFSLLFGLGFAIQFDRAKAKGARAFWIQLRRMVVLYGFGVVLMALFAGNPILVRYAVLGLLLIPFHWLPPRAILATAFVMLLVASVDGPLHRRSREQNRQRALSTQGAGAQQNAGQRPPQGQPTFGEATARGFRQSSQVIFTRGFYFSRMSDLFSMFLLGLYAGKRRIHANLAAHRPLMLRVMAWGLALGITGTTLGGILADWAKTGLMQVMTYRFAYIGGGNLQGLGYAAGIVLLAGNAGWWRRLHVLAFAGRMPLTNYLTQWMIMRILFDRFFIGLNQTLGLAAGFLIACGILALQLGWSRWWMARFRFGPAEWLWKTLAYLKVQPMHAGVESTQPPLQPSSCFAS